MAQTHYYMDVTRGSGNYAGQKYFLDPDDGNYYPVFNYNNRTGNMTLLSNPTLNQIGIANAGDIFNQEDSYMEAFYIIGSNERALYYPTEEFGYRPVYIHQQKETYGSNYALTLFYYDGFGEVHDLGTWRSNEQAGEHIGFDLYYGKNNKYYVQETLRYRDANGVLKRVTCDDGSTLSAPMSVTSGAGYHNANKYKANGSNATFTLYVVDEYSYRYDALKDAVEEFVGEAKQTALENDVEYRVAIVGFAGENDANTEQLTGVPDPRGKQYHSLTDADYQAALQDVATDEGLADLTASKNAIDANGAKEPVYGFKMAKNILANSGDRNKVVIFFTDGKPGSDARANQIAEANAVVSKAKELKDAGALIFSVGVFKEGDNQPLTYATQTYANQNNYVSYSDGWYFYRSNAVATAAENYNDNIKNYMQCVSSDYPAATGFMDNVQPTTGTTAATCRGTKDAENEYYMNVIDSARLKDAFKKAMESTQESTTPVSFDDNAVLTDIVNLADFALPSDLNAGVTAYSKELTTTDDTNYTEGAVADTFNPSTNAQTGEITVSGFDYSAKHTTSVHHGEKLIVEIKGLMPKHGGLLASNGSPDANISQEGVTAVSIGSPTVNIKDKTYVADFNGKMNLATGAMLKDKTTNLAPGTNGNFTKDENNNAYYQLKSGELLTSTKEAPADLTYKANVVDSAMIYGMHAGDNGAAWKQVNVVPASNIYYADSFSSDIAADDQIGYSAGQTATGEDKNVQQILSFTFTGSRIDVYLKTTSSDGTIGAILTTTDGNGETKKVTKMVACNTDSTYASTPAVSFDGLSGTSTLTITGGRNAKITLNGVRVYNADANDVEQHVQYVKLREMLLDPENAPVQDKTETGAMFFVTDGMNLDPDDTDSKTPADQNSDEFKKYVPKTYKNLGPKHEVYLANGQAIGFSVDGAKSVMVGLRAPKGGDVYVSATGEIKTTDDGTCAKLTDLDMYYPISPVNGTYVITNDTNVLVSATNVKLTDVPAGTGLSVSPELLTFMASFVRSAPADTSTTETPETPVTPEAPETHPKQVWNDAMSLLNQLFSRIMSALNQLFGGLGNW